MDPGSIRFRIGWNLIFFSTCAKMHITSLSRSLAVILGLHCEYTVHKFLQSIYISVLRPLPQCGPIWPIFNVWLDIFMKFLLTVNISACVKYHTMHFDLLVIDHIVLKIHLCLLGSSYFKQTSKQSTNNFICKKTEISSSQKWAISIIQTLFSVSNHAFLTWDQFFTCLVPWMPLAACWCPWFNVQCNQR